MEEIKEYLHEFDNANDFYDLYESVPMKYPASVYVEATEYVIESPEGTNVSMTLPFSGTSVSLYYGIEENTIYALYSDGNRWFFPTQDRNFMSADTVIPVQPGDITNVEFSANTDSQITAYTLNNDTYTLYDYNENMLTSVYKNNSDNYMFIPPFTALFVDLSPYYDAVNKTFDLSTYKSCQISYYNYSSETIDIGESNYYEPWVSLTTFNNSGVINEVVDVDNNHYIYDGYDFNNGYRWRSVNTYDAFYSQYRIPTDLHNNGGFIPVG